METSDVLRHQRIKHLVASRTDDAASVSVGLWAQMAVQIVSIIGENGFHSLYARSVLLAQPQFPWLMIDPPLTGDGNRFAELKKCFERQIPAQINEANGLLLITFTDILASIIGEQLTGSILSLAWGNDDAYRADTEFKHE
ncbi:MAG TPA: hypothetical protein VFW53_07985 [Gallionella sp.]|nr:hypothetical protein [Gallionella sp.]